MAIRTRAGYEAGEKTAFWTSRALLLAHAREDALRFLHAPDRVVDALRGLRVARGCQGLRARRGIDALRRRGGRLGLLGRARRRRELVRQLRRRLELLRGLTLVVRVQTPN